jgi:lipoprotein-anchoring transpeptidase ErfK/SrfK
MDLRPRPLLVALAAAVALVAVPAIAQAITMPQRDDAVTVKRYLMGRVSPHISARGSVHIWTNTGYSLRRAVYPVIERRTLKDGTEWVKIRVVRRPRGVDTWVPAWATRRKWVAYHLVVDLSSRKLYVYRAGKQAKHFRVVVGARGTETPRGHYYIVDHMRLHNSWARGVWALATSAYSAKLKHFDGGDGQVALHARGSLAARLGTAASHGCVRFADSSIAWLARVVQRGTPVDITR